MEWIIWLLVIFVSDIIAMLLYDKYKDHKRPDLLCDGCKLPRKCNKTSDGKFWLCKRCKQLYKEEINA